MFVRLLTRAALSMLPAVGFLLAFANGVAGADSLAGMTYSDAAEKVSAWGTTAIISTVLGDDLQTDECIVVSSRKTSFVGDDNFEHKDGYLVALNCTARLAAPGTPGNSAASPAGRAQKELVKKADWINGEDGSLWCVENAEDCGNFCESSGLCTNETLSAAGG